MKKSINLILGVHNHQPVDNWDHVIEDAYEKCYRPFMDVLEAHPGVKMAMHFTGYLLDWVADKHPELIEQLRRMIARGQVEMFTGGFYEPILAIIPDADKIGQIKKLTRRVEELTGYTPRGLWQAERVWEPHLVKYLADAGVEYLFLDDAHFKSVGLDDEELLGRYTSEEQGQMVDIFPIRKDLRYFIPYAEPERTVEYLAGLATEGGERAGIYFDDGEKFGVWPGSFKSVYKEKWLDRFFSAIEARSDVIKSVTPSEYAAKVPSFGRIYLPTASYSEMLEWALPARHMNEYERGQKATAPEYQRFFRGGFWRHFLVKYPEANNLHKKMLYVSQKIHQAEQHTGRPMPEAKDELWKGQSNDVFWHGVFGGLYLTNLRTANYQHLLKAETLADDAMKGKQFLEIHQKDFDCDGKPELLVESHTQNVYLDPDEGGGIFELDYRLRHFNLLDTLTRRYEGYHDKLVGATHEGDGAEGQTQSIHDRVVTKEKNLHDFLHYDWYRRMSLLDHFFGPDATLDKLYRMQYPEQGDFVNQPYQISEIQPDSVTLTRNGRVWVGDQHCPITVEKRLTFDRTQAQTAIRYRIINHAGHTVQLWFSPEFNANFLAPTAPDRYYYVPGPAAKPTGTSATGSIALMEPELEKQLKNRHLNSKGRLEQVPGIGIIDEWLGINYALHFSQAADVWRFPVETVSQSESGFERVYQSSAIFPHWRFELPPQGEWTVEITQLIRNHYA
jgi:hypothetical protein